jgi:hypothetical protein
MDNGVTFSQNPTHTDRDKIQIDRRHLETIVQDCQMGIHQSNGIFRFLDFWYSLLSLIQNVIFNEEKNSQTVFRYFANAGS